jgi:aminoglycoside phosphotransferase (APT) family kinase protein
LRRFQRTSAGEPAPWREQETLAGLDTVRHAWMLLHPDSAAGAVRRARMRLEPLHGVPLLRCVTHGDFSPTNLAAVGEQLKVLDWEWCTLQGAPHFDLWSYQLAELHWQMRNRGARQLDRRIADAARFVEGQLQAIGAERAFALATLPLVLAELVVRVRRTFGRLGPWEQSSARLLAAVEALLAEGDSGAR